MACHPSINPSTNLVQNNLTWYSVTDIWHKCPWVLKRVLFFSHREESPADGCSPCADDDTETKKRCNGEVWWRAADKKEEDWSRWNVLNHCHISHWCHIKYFYRNDKRSLKLKKHNRCCGREIYHEEIIKRGIYYYLKYNQWTSKTKIN